MNKELRKIAVKGFDLINTAAHATIKTNPFVSNVVNGKPVGYGDIANEHLADPILDDKLVEDLRAAGVEVCDYTIDIPAFKDYLERANYPKDYPDLKTHFAEKTLEHYVSAHVLEFQPSDVFMDVAASTSPFHEIAKRLWPLDKVYQQDLCYEPGVHGHRVGGDAGALPLPDNAINKATLHCSLEHFEGDSDMALFREMDRVLLPGGKLCILPFYIAHEYTIHTDPIRYFFTRDIVFDPESRIRYFKWKQRHMRMYDIEHVKKRILPSLGRLKMKVLRVTNFQDVDPICYLRFIALFEKQ